MERSRRFYDPLVFNIPSAIAFFGLALLVLLLSAEFIGVYSTWMDWVALVLLACFSGIFGGLQFGITKPYLGVVRAQARDGNAAAQRALPIVKRATVIRYSLMVAATMMGVKISTLTDKLMPATVAFLFSSVVLVVCGEILPSKFFTQDSVRKVAGLAPFIWLCHWSLGPVTKGTNWAVNLVLPDEPEALIQESALPGLVDELAREEALTGISPLEAKLIRSVLSLDDLLASNEANPVHPYSIVLVPRDAAGIPIFPEVVSEEYFSALSRSRKRFAIICDPASRLPYGVVDVERHGFLLSCGDAPSLLDHFFEPTILTEPLATLADGIDGFVVNQDHHEDLVIDHDVILVANNSEIGILTGAELMGLHYELIAHKNRPYLRRKIGN
jgi:hypothetical protein